MNHLISVITVALREITFIVLDSTGEPVPMVSEVVRVVSLSTTEIPEITRLKIRLQLRKITINLRRSPDVDYNFWFNQFIVYDTGNKQEIMLRRRKMRRSYGVRLQ